jgi:hypothetical protein
MLFEWVGITHSTDTCARDVLMKNAHKIHNWYTRLVLCERSQAITYVALESCAEGCETGASEKLEERRPR